MVQRTSEQAARAAAIRRARRLKRIGALGVEKVLMVPPANHQCDICKSDTPGGRGGWHIDHDHESGRIRGWLCANCNQALGKLKDSPAILVSALNYLTNHGKAIDTEQAVALLTVHGRS